MGYARYTVTRNGQEIEAGYDVEAVCEKDGCTNQIDRGLAYLCGKTPGGGDEDGCGGYFCEHHLRISQQCEPCAKVADDANTWTNPETGEDFDLRDYYLPKGERYDARGWVWKHLGEHSDGVPILVPVQQPDFRPGGHGGCLITEYEFENAAVVAYRQMHEAGGGDA